MASTNNAPQIHLNISFSDPETAAAFGSALGNSEALQALVMMLSGQGTAAQNQRVKAARAPRAVAETAQGEWTAKQYRDWVRAYEAAHPSEKLEVPMTGPLSKSWKEWLDGFIAKVEGGVERPEFVDDAEVVDEPAEAELEATPTETEETEAKPKSTGNRMLRRQARKAPAQ